MEVKVSCTTAVSPRCQFYRIVWSVVNENIFNSQQYLVTPCHTLT